MTGGTTATINNSSSGATYNFSGLIDTNTSNTVTFNGGSNATYNMGGGIYAHGSGSMVFSAGTFNIGTVTTTSDCNSTSNYSICLKGSGSLTFGGPSAFTLAGGIYQNASGMPSSAALNLGYGSTTNSFSIGKASDGYSLNEANGATLFGDASGTGDLFQMAGSLTTSGGTCVAVSAAAEHDVNGSISGAGGIVLGSGIYTVNGYVALGNSSGGYVVNCPTVGTTTGLTALEVTLVISGTSTVSCGSTSSAFCLGAGYTDRDIDCAYFVVDIGQQHRRPRGDRPAIVQQHGDSRIHDRSNQYADFRCVLFSQWCRDHERRCHTQRQRRRECVPDADRLAGYIVQRQRRRLDLRRLGQRYHRRRRCRLGAVNPRNSV